MPLNTSAGNTLATATSLNLTPLNPIQVSGSNVNVNTSAPDFYAIRFSGRSSLNLSLTCLTPPTGNGSNSNINVEVLASNGTTLVQKSENGGSLSESVNLLDQAAGLYYIRVYTASATSADYSLNLSTRNLVRSDLVWRNYSSGVADSGKTSLWTMNGTTRTQGQEVLPRVADASWRVETTGDFNSDGQADLVWRNYSSNSPDSGKTSIWLMNGTNRVQGQEVLPRVSDLSWQVVGTGDFNSDGKTDLVWRNYSTGLADSGKTSVWFMDGTTRVQGQEVQPTARVTDTNWRIDAVGDFNNDGQSDLVWRNYSTGLADSGKTTVWFMNGTTRVQGQEVQPSARVTDTNWQIVGAGDFNGDGQADLVWRNYSSNSPDSGKTTVWIMNGTTRVQGQEVQPSARVTDLNWQVVGVSARYDVPPRSDIDGNSLPTAFNIGTLNGSGIYRDAVSSSSSDVSDYYAFTVSSPVTLDLTLDGLSDNADVEILNSSGSSINLISEEPGTDTDSISADFTTAGTYYIRVYSAGGSTNYNLNLTVTATGIDLRGTLNGFNAPPSINLPQPPTPNGTVPPVSPINVTYQIQNSGVLSAGTFQVSFYLSSDPIITAPATGIPGDYFLGTQTVNSLVGGGLFNGTVAVTLPKADDFFWSSDRTYYIGMVIDSTNQITESSEINNVNIDPNASSGTLFDAIAVTGTLSSDLTGSSITGPAQVTAPVSGTTPVTVNYQLKNLGRKPFADASGQPRGFTVSFFLSKDNRIVAGSDRLLRNQDVSVTLGATGTSTDTSAVLSTTLNIPARDDAFWTNNGGGGQYYIGMIIDSDNEVDPTSGRSNNSNQGLNIDFVPITVSLV